MFGMDILRIFKHNSAPGRIARACVRARARATRLGTLFYYTIARALLYYGCALLYYCTCARTRVQWGRAHARSRAMRAHCYATNQIIILFIIYNEIIARERVLTCNANTAHARAQTKL